MQQKKKIYLEIIRIISIILVVFNHTGKSGFLLFVNCKSTILYFIYMGMAILCKIAVPLFFMVSGALLLGKEEDYKVLYKKRVLRMVIVLVLFSLLQYLYIIYKENSSFELRKFLTRIYTSNMVAAYWYLYAYLAFLVMLPLLRKMISAMNNKDFRYLIILNLVIVGVLPILSTFFRHKLISLNSNFKVYFAISRCIFYPIIGYYVDRIPINDIKKKHICFGIAASIIGVIITEGITTYMFKSLSVSKFDFAEYFFKSFMVITTITVFILIKKICDKINFTPIASKIISTIGGLTFGTMLIENIVRENIKPVFAWLDGRMFTMLACIISVLCIVTISMMITFVIKLIPGMKKLI